MAPAQSVHTYAYRMTLFHDKHVMPVTQELRLVPLVSHVGSCTLSLVAKDAETSATECFCFCWLQGLLQQAALDLRARHLLARLAPAMWAWLALARRRRQLQRLHKRLLAALRMLRLQQVLCSWRAAAARLASLAVLQQQVAARHRQCVLQQVLAAWQHRAVYALQLAEAAHKLAAVMLKLRLELRVVFAKWLAWVQAAREETCCRLRRAVQLRACFATWVRYRQYRQGKQAAAQAILADADAARRRRCLAAWFMEARSSQQARVQHRAAVKHWRLYKLWRALQSWRSYTAGQAAKAQAKQLAETFRWGLPCCSAFQVWPGVAACLVVG